jgi:hypothetical protein
MSILEKFTQDSQWNVNALQGVNVVRIGEAEPIKEREKVLVNGLISVPAEHITKSTPETIDVDNSFVLYNLHRKTITFYQNQGAIYNAAAQYAGRIESSKEIERLAVNSNTSYTPLELSSFIKMNRYMFKSKNVTMKLVSELRNFKAKIDKEIEVSSDSRGNTRELRAQAIESNLPNSFTVIIPVFEGGEKEAFDVEIEIDPVDLSCSLISPEIKEYMDTHVENIIMGQLDIISAAYPKLRIFQE